jgi:hypothetical protein
MAAFFALDSEVIAAPIAIAANDDLVPRDGRAGAIWYVGNKNIASQFGSANFDTNTPTAVTAGVIGARGCSFAGGQCIDQATHQNLLNGVANNRDLNVSDKRGGRGGLLAPFAKPQHAPHVSVPQNSP